MRLVLLVCAIAVHVSGCGCESNPGTATDDAAAGTGDGSVPCISGLASLTLAPALLDVKLDGNTPSPISFTATGSYSDGHTEVIPGAALAWSASRADATPPGTIAAGVLTPHPAGGTVTVTAMDGCGKSGTATVNFTVDVTLGTPSDPGAWTGAPQSTGSVPLVVYPSAETRFPRNIYRTLFQWRSQGHTQFRLTFDGPGGKVTVFTDGAYALCATATPAAGCWEADEKAWGFIAGSNAGKTVSWIVDALDTSTAPPTVRRAAPIPIGFSKQDVQGAIFYWSTTSAGIRRANVAAAQPEDYITGKPGTQYASPADQVKCVACHVVSRDGKYMAAPVDAMSGKSLWIMEVTKTAPPNPLVKQIAGTGGHGFATISPDNAHLVAAWKGKMWMLDRVSGNKIGDLALGTLKGTHPDWSPDGTNVVFATGDGDAPAGASIATIPYTNPGWGAPSVLVPAAGGLTNLFPMYSPDGKWIAFSRGKGGHGDLAAQLFVVGAGAGSAPVELVNANRVVNNQLGNGQTENSQPTWAPPGDFEWVAFNSKRPYGVVIPQGGLQQLWVAAVDKSKLGTGQDPSFPAFRLQFQGLNEDNHRAYWTLDVRDPVPDAGAPPDLGPCVPGGQMCDPSQCCETGYICDTIDNGATYECIPRPPIM
jgi:hypothetical protein